MTVTQLRAFLAVVHGGSVTAAADDLIVTQPSVSSAIAALSRELGCELFERDGRGIRLTDAGAAFVPYAVDVLGLIERGGEVAREAASAALRRLRLAAVTSAAESFVPPLMSASAVERGVELILDVGNAQYVFDRVRSHRADIAFAGQPPDDDRLVAQPLLENRIVCVTAAGDPRASGGALPASALADSPWLLREPGSGTRAMAEQFLCERRLNPRTLTLGSNGAIKQAARAGLGVALLARATVDADLAAGSLGEIALLDGPAVRSWFLVRSAVGPVPPVVADFARFVAEQCE